MVCPDLPSVNSTHLHCVTLVRAGLVLVKFFNCIVLEFQKDIIVDMMHFTEKASQYVY